MNGSSGVPAPNASRKPIAGPRSVLIRPFGNWIGRPLRIQLSPHAIRSILGLAIYAGLVGIAFGVNYPGRLTPDSLDMLTQASHPQILNNWHEPATTGFWLIFAPLLGQPAGALFIQALLIFVYPAILIARAISQRPIQIPLLLGLAAFTGALICITGLVSKDVPMAGLILCLLGVFDTDLWNRPRKRGIIAVTFLVFCMVLVRPTNVLLFGFAALAWIAVRRIRARIAIPAFLLICAVCGFAPSVTKFVDRHVFGAADARPENALIIFDVAGISTAIHSDLFAGLPGWPTAKILRPWQCYTPDRWDPFRWGECKEYYAAFVRTKIEPMSWWVQTIIRHPVGYAIHKMKYASSLFRYPIPISTFGMPYAANVPSGLNDLNGSYTDGFDMRGSFQLWRPRHALAPFNWAAALVFSKPILVISLFACMLVFVRAWRAGRNRDRIDLVEVAAGGLGTGNVLMLIMFGPAVDARYLLPTFACGLVIILRRLDRARSLPGYRLW